jgi:adenylylsulfate kinase
MKVIWSMLKKMVDTTKRSFLKSFTWRFIAFCLLSVISYGATKNVKDAAYITFSYHGLQIFIYFLHERLWNFIKWGKSKGMFIQMTGLSGAGKTTIARELEKRLLNKGYKVEIIDGDEYREGLCKDLGFSKEDRNTNIRRLGFVGKVLSRNNVITIMSAINPYEEVRKELKENCGAKTVFVKCSLDTCISRDVKGLYAKALSGEIKNFTGVSDPFELPENIDLVIDTDLENLKKSVDKLEDFIISNVG